MTRQWLNPKNTIRCSLKPLLLLLVPLVVKAQRDSTEPANQRSWNFHFQQTIVTQWHPSFQAGYSGDNSLQPETESRTSLTSTLCLGVKLWQGGEWYVNPEISGGEGLSGATGVAGFPNGETFRIGNPTPTISLARLYLQQTFGLGDELEEQIDGPNKLASRIPAHRLTVYAGRFSLSDFFDDNAFSHDPRTQFLNWALMNNGAWDYAADTRGYTWGFGVEFHDSRWALRAATTLVPKEANKLEMDTNIKDAFSINLEFEQGHTISEHNGVVRVLVYRNLARMGSYREAIDNPIGTTDVTLTRKYSRTKYGIGLNIEQELSDASGMFVRFGWNDGHNETWAFTEIDRTISTGILLNGRRWKRPADQAGAAVVVNGLSNDHEDYLAAGGYGFIIGDGRLNYAPEVIVETFYSLQLTSQVSATCDYQFVSSPAYNRDRGPVHVFSIRLHTEL